MRFIGECSRKYGLRIPNVFHAGDGNIHPLVLYDERDADQVRRALGASHDILEKCVEFGGSVTGEHGIGVEKIDFMARQFSPEDLEAMRMLRRVFDPRAVAIHTRCFPVRSAAATSRCASKRPRDDFDRFQRCRGDRRAAVCVHEERKDFRARSSSDAKCSRIHAGGHDGDGRSGRYAGAVAGAPRRAQSVVAHRSSGADTLTIGALLAANRSGPRRFGYGTIREHLLGIKVVLATAE
jgi:FAD/FMN-containing dehydrogenase